MEKELRWYDHKSTNLKLVRVILVVSELFTFIVIGVVFSMTEFEETDFLSFGIVGIFMILFFALPHFLLAITTKPKETVFDLTTKTIHWFERKKEVKTLPFQSINSISYSEYSYTVKTKNGSRTVTVYTVLGNVGLEKIQLIEGTNYSKLRFDGEKICKHLHIPILTSDGLTIQPSEFDLPIHKRKIPQTILDQEIQFSKDSMLSVVKQNQKVTLKSNYKQGILVFVALCVSIALTLIIQFAIGDLFSLSVSHWEMFPPSIGQLVFLFLNLVLGFFPYLYVFYQQKRAKEISITKTSIEWYGKEYPFSNWEDLIQIDSKLCLVNDTKLVSFSLFYFCETGDITNVRHWILKQIFEISGNDPDLVRFG
ncbi:MAG: hypothetical protein IBJ01_10665 [Leptospira sp.]|uniref:hypothetical protein n=1 Tax=Leptospira sp. TaxID=178 RepID=UPI0025C3D3AB|nr:hypothetical protein [Leptospira sp.]MBL0955217.1 hypothetical protein [Leptospira sp.]